MTSTRRLRGIHGHGCVGCGGRYNDACTTSGTNGRCHACRTGRPRTPNGFDPAPCCGQHSRPVRDADTLARYGLGGEGSWWQCRGCFRTHPFDPATPNTNTKNNTQHPDTPNVSKSTNAAGGGTMEAGGNADGRHGR